jgi:Tannase and feruloyl esterase
MKRHAPRLLAAVLPIVFSLAQSATAAPNCEALAKLTLPETTITLAKTISDGAFTPPAGRGTPRPIENVPAFCEVHGVIKPAATSAVNFEVWLPASNWNGRLETVGNGGLAGTISFPAMAAALRNGFAAASTDTGHTTTEPRTWLEDRERLIDYSYRGLHLTTVNAKSIIDAYYGRKANYAYYSGCSTGGKQGLMEAQRFPADFDGIIAGDAANFWTHQMASEIWNGVVTGTPESKLPPEKLQLLQGASLAACDALDGAKDGMVSDPARCHFDPGKLQCKGADAADCLTAAQVEAVRKIYSGPMNPRTGKSVYPGLYPGGEVGWGGRGGGAVINRTATSGVSSNDFMSYAMFHNPDWKFRSFDFDRDLAQADEKFGPITNATDPNLDEFRKLGHKMIYYHGAADPLIPAQNGVNYYSSVVNAEKGLERTQGFFRAFLVPGLYHCAGGPGPIAFGTSQPAPPNEMDADHDITSAIIRWVEKGAAPDKIIATKYVDNTPSKGIAFQRPLCAYPEVARYKGSGDQNDAANFTCAR